MARKTTSKFSTGARERAVRTVLEPNAGSQVAWSPCAALASIADDAHLEAPCAWD